MDIQVRYAESDQERAEIYRLRYDIFVNEMQILIGPIDHENKMMSDADDETARLIYATVDNEVVGTVRLHWGGDAPFPQKFYDTYDLTRFEPVVSLDQLVVFTRLMVRNKYRGTMLSFQLMAAIAEFSLAHKVQLTFCDCRPYLLNLYTSLGYRTYTKTYNDPNDIFLVPLVLVVEDLEYFKQINSPLLAFAPNVEFSSDVPAKVAALLPQTPVVQSVTDDAARWARAYGLATGSDGQNNLIFEGLTETDIAILMKRSFIVRCKKNDRIIGKGYRERTVFIVLSGLVEVREGEQIVAVLSKGDVIGELAFLLNAERLADVYAVSDDVSILSLNEKVLAGLLENEPKIAARLFYNLSKVISTRVVSLYHQAYV